jgi:hypothetical protein
MYCNYLAAADGKRNVQPSSSGTVGCSADGDHRAPTRAGAGQSKSRVLGALFTEKLATVHVHRPAARQPPMHEHRTRPGRLTSHTNANAEVAASE